MWTDNTAGNWSLGTNLSYSGWSSSGNAASELTGSTGDNLENASILGASTIDEGTTYWGGFLLNNTAASTANRTWGFQDGASFRMVITTDSSNNITLGTRDGAGDDSDGNLTTGSPIAMGTASTNLLLFRIDAASGNDNLYAWWNPDLSLGEPSIGAATWSSVGLDNFATTGNLSVFRFASSNAQQVTVDELRLATSLSEIAVVPESSSYGLLAGFFGLSAVAFFRRR